MDVGKWIMFAFLAGAVLVGFQTRSLRWYEFAVSGLFAMLLDALVFGGQIVSWIGELGSNVPDAAGAATGSVLLADPRVLARARVFTGRVWANRPAPLDYAGGVAAVVIATIWAHLSLPTALVAAGVGLAAVSVAAAFTEHPKHEKEEKAEREGLGADGDG